jgi:hypothetical protein
MVKGESMWFEAVFHRLGGYARSVVVTCAVDDRESATGR